MKFIDLFAGLGGFHVALEKLGHTCVFASEKSEDLAILYEKNFGIEVDRDITKISVKEIPKFDILCAGFPCQPFSKAGSQEGLRDSKNGNLFYKIAEILDFHKPKYFILENVRNLEKHDRGKTWQHIKGILEKELKYNITTNVYSPHNIGIPQHRERFFIVGDRDEELGEFKWPNKNYPLQKLDNYIIENYNEVFEINENKKNALKVWQGFIKAFPKHHNLPSWPIWSMEFGADYPFINTTPFSSNNYVLGKHKGAFGISLSGCSRDEKFSRLPSYARTQENVFPKWKQRFISNNRLFYKKYKTLIDEHLPQIKTLPIASYQKFEWNYQKGKRDIYSHLIQFRGSGIRVKRADYFPSLVTVRTQTPIVGWQQRYITPLEGAKIQALEMLELPSSLSTAYRALGNAVNSEIVYLIAKSFIGEKSKVGIKPNYTS